MSSATSQQDDTARLLDQVSSAIERRQALRIRGADSKAFLGRRVQAEDIDTRTHSGVVHYDPTELVITVRAGTRVSDLNTLLAAQGQHLPPESPDFAGQATVGGMVASALAGPRRPWAGSVRDFVLGTRVITGHGQHLRFGGEVMKNVAGYDFSRLLAGSHGCLGLITEVSLKVLPLPRKACSLALETDASTAMSLLTQWRRDDLPVSGAFHWKERLHVRLEGGEATVDAARARVGGEQIDPSIWADLRERKLKFFDSGLPLWRLSVPWQTRLAPLPGDTLVDWAGAQRWLASDAQSQNIRELATSLGGHADCYTPGIDDSPFQPLPKVLMRFHKRLKAQVDPHSIFNHGRMYAGL